MEIREHVSLAGMTTLQVGGPARYFAEARFEDDVREAIRFAQSHKLPLFVLGGGSNLVVSDEGWPGLALKIAIKGINHRHGHGVAYFDAGAGEDWDGFVAATVAHHCAGLECLSGIPGSVGGTPVQNVGAYGQEVSETIQAVEAIEVSTLESREFEKGDCGFAYRSSVFNAKERGKYVIVKVSYALKHDGAPRIAYGDLKKHFAGWSESPTLAQVREAVRKIRASKGMLLVPGDEDCRSAGSFFKNPVLSVEQFAEVERRAAAKNLAIPSYPALEAQRKISAAWLVEHSGFSKGYGFDHVGISRRHALAIVNRGGAKASEVLALAEQIQQRVEEIWGVRLEREPVLVGERESVVSS
ncbi:MAG TPA: UDP-N-acetylmuramate dehydrogenase [Terriglobales bacterium]|jgi:UDP-N-acetylmuramate dehydrogenase|nr:UDP-N-acetylmuramate dehydrogenase [Terriglobales bacterium]